MTIAFLILGCCNMVLVVLPWYQNRLRLYMTQLTASMPTMPGQPQILFNYTATLMILSCILGLVIYGFVFWLLHRHRAAFKTLPAAEPILEA